MIRILRMTGELPSGPEGDGGTVWHAVDTGRGYGGDFTDPALCGARPRIEWANEEGHEVTCPCCREKLGSTGGR